MKESILKYIICPECRTDFSIIRHDGPALKELLVCKNNHCYPVINGVPVLIKNGYLKTFLNPAELTNFFSALKQAKTSTAKPAVPDNDEELRILKNNYVNWSLQWNEATSFDESVWKDKKRFFEHIPIDPEKLSSYSMVLEIACGRGCDIQHVITQNNVVFAIDISESAYIANKKYENYGNVFVVRCDVSAMPFRDNTFGLVFADHFLHHSHAVKKCLAEIRRVSAHKADFIFNLYSKENNQIMTRFIEPLKHIALNRAPVKLVYLLSNIAAFFLWLALRLIYFPAYTYANKLYRHLPLGLHMTFWLKFDYIQCRSTCFDLLHAPFVRYYNNKDAARLAFENLIGLNKMYLLRQTLWVCKGSISKTSDQP